jgi:hypothetical protein
MELQDDEPNEFDTSRRNLVKRVADAVGSGVSINVMVEA